MKASLDALTASWAGVRYIGLFQNDLTILRTTVIDQIIPCDFSGYIGLRSLMGWSPAAILGDRALTQAPPFFWEHDGGPVSNWVVGYYVVDLSGTLMWAQRRAGPAKAMFAAGQTYAVAAQFSLGSRFPPGEG